MSDSLILKPGMSLGAGRYVLDRLLKQGRSSLTLQGTQVSSGKVCVLKFPLQGQEFLSIHCQRYQQIWQRIGHFQHPYLQQTLDYLEEQGIPCLVLEKIPGTPLAKHFIRPTPLPETTALRLIFQVAQGLQQLHDRGLVHGDLKPHNLIQHSQSKALVLVDWGLFCGDSDKPEYKGGDKPGYKGSDKPEYKGSDKPQYKESGGNSQPLSAYSAPEPLMPMEFRPSLDVYSLAACLYTLVTGHSPISAAQRSTTPLVLPQVLTPSLTSMTQEAILRGMDLDPDRRSNSLQAWLTLLPQPYSPAQLPNLQPAASPERSGAGNSFSGSGFSGNGSSPPPGAEVGLAEAGLVQAGQPIPKTRQTRIAAASANGKPPESTSPAHHRSLGFQHRPLLTSLWVMTIAAGLGVSAGLFFRWQKTQNSFAQSLFQNVQSFPPQAWPGTLDLQFPEDAPLPEANSGADHYGNSEDSYQPYEALEPDPIIDGGEEPEPVFSPAEDSQEVPPADLSADPFEPLPSNPESFEDPLYGESEFPSDPLPQDPPADILPAEELPEN